MIIHITQDDADKRYCGEFDLAEWLTGGKDGYGDQFNAQAVVILTKAVKMLMQNSLPKEDIDNDLAKRYQSKMCLTENQIEIIKTMRKYPDDMIMQDGFLTGGHGVKFNMASVRVLKKRKLIETWGERRNKLSELGKTITLEN